MNLCCHCGKRPRMNGVGRLCEHCWTGVVVVAADRACSPACPCQAECTCGAWGDAPHLDDCPVAVAVARMAGADRQPEGSAAR